MVVSSERKDSSASEPFLKVGKAKSIGKLVQIMRKFLDHFYSEMLGRLVYLTTLYSFAELYFPRRTSARYKYSLSGLYWQNVQD